MQKTILRVLFVHGMGRSPASGWPLLLRIRQAGLKTSTFGYSATFENFDSITARLRKRISLLASSGDYVVIGHSLGGVLLRAALNSLPKGTKQPQHVYLLGSPMQPSRIATKLKSNMIYRAIAGDCGQLLGSPERLKAIGSVAVPTTCIVGIRGIGISRRLFNNEANDGIVSVSEVSAPWVSSHIEVPVVHTLLPSSKL
ncbi:MAG TPA: alpha/beta hydrolase, partial [Methylotenera sp.]|nr:alpha/beta hydrolase [Methylotenera sp.]